MKKEGQEDEGTLSGGKRQRDGKQERTTSEGKCRQSNN